MPYRAPELWEPPRPEGVTEAVDVWGAGCVGFAMAYGFSPFECSLDEEGVGTVQAVSHLRVLGTIPFPEGDREDMSVELASRDEEQVEDHDEDTGRGVGHGHAKQGNRRSGVGASSTGGGAAGGGGGCGRSRPRDLPRYTLEYRMLVLDMLRKRPSSRVSAVGALRRIERMLGRGSSRGHLEVVGSDASGVKGRRRLD